jgi:hypothetical protein
MIIFLAVVAVGLAAGFARRGSLHSLSSAHLRAIPLILLAVLLQGLAWKVVPARLSLLAYAFVVVSYAAVFAFTLANRRAPWIAVIALGALMNFSVILLNQGMPTSARAAAHLGFSAEDTRALLMRGKHVLETDSTRLRFLGDVIPIPGDGSLASPGDIIIWAGLALMLQSLMIAGAPTLRRAHQDVEHNRRSHVITR